MKVAKDKITEISTQQKEFKKNFDEFWVKQKEIMQKINSELS